MMEYFGIEKKNDVLSSLHDWLKSDLASEEQIHFIIRKDPEDLATRLTDKINRFRLNK